MILKPLGHQQITALSSAVSLTVPAGAQRAILCPQAQAIRFQDNGGNPTASIGIYVGVNERFWYNGDLAALRVIEAAASAKLDVSYYA